MPRWSLVDLTDSQTGEWTITPSDKSSEYVDALSRVLSPVTVVEVPPVTPLQMPQPARPIMFVPAQKPDWAIEPLPVAMGPSGRAVEKAPSSAFPRLNANSSTSVPGISASKKALHRLRRLQLLQDKIYP
ncbi:hypothetical protein AX14_004773 [Amanita brunnescens Koide BX004]|nr:hypothetical protein AX14_004773 [Amanita brunnescens Koide BX004]